MTEKQNDHVVEKVRYLKAILVGVELPRATGQSLAHAMEELEGLATTAYYTPMLVITQRLTNINPKTFLGSGKVEELTQAVELHKPDVVIIDENLSPGQTRNLEKIIKCKVIDRSGLILEIFMEHARSRESKVQVELARLKYSLPRLTRMWGHLSRQRGGIGMREVGETQIQLDRRLVRDEIHKLEEKLKQIDREKQTQRKSRKGIYKVSLVGYTNVGKSSLMNCLTGANTLVEDKLFATLDATTRKVKKNFPFPILLSDTVGLINKLPHDLVASFKSTLDEVRDADLLIKVADICHPDVRNQMATTDRLLDELGVAGTASILVFNKIDKASDPNLLDDMMKLHPKAIGISCRTRDGLDELRKEIIRHYEKRLVALQVNVSYAQSKIISDIRKYALIVKEHYGETEITLDLRFEPGEKNRLEKILKTRFSFPEP